MNHSWDYPSVAEPGAVASKYSKEIRTTLRTEHLRACFEVLAEQPTVELVLQLSPIAQPGSHFAQSRQGQVECNYCKKPAGI